MEYSLNDTCKRFIFHLTATVQIPGSKWFDTQMKVQTATQNTAVSLAQKFQIYLPNKSRKHDNKDNGKHKKVKQQKVYKHGDHMQHNQDVEHQDMKIYCATNHFLGVKFLGPHKKTHGVRGLGKHHHMSFDPKLGNSTNAICFIICACTLYTSILEQTCIPGFSEQKKPRYQPVKDCTYWPE